MWAWNADGSDAGKVGEVAAVWDVAAGPTGTAGWWEVSASIMGLCAVCALRSAVDAWARVAVRYYSPRQRLVLKMKTVSKPRDTL